MSLTYTNDLINGRYILNANPLLEEVDRYASNLVIIMLGYIILNRRKKNFHDSLNSQYQLTKALFGHEDILHDLFFDISLRKDLNILDAATGSGAWIMDVARLSNAQANILSTATPMSFKLFACDISSEKFPSCAITEPLGIQFFIQDVTKPFPEEMENKFDVVNMSMLSLALTEDGWNTAFRNVYDVLSRLSLLVLFKRRSNKNT
jgi:SAM-dependent methyltransferase